MSRRLLLFGGLTLAAVGVVLLTGCPPIVPPTSTDPTDTTDPTAFTNADAARGGALYDKWWAVTGDSAPTTDHPLWASRPDTTSNTRTGADTWRCKECHAWDYKGVSGAYSSGSHRTGIAGIYGTTMTAQEVFDEIKGAHDAHAQNRATHDYGDVLSDADIWDLAKFVKNGQIDTDTMINSSGAFTGDANAGQTLYDSGIGTSVACAACHGADGLTPPPGSPDHDEWVGLLADDNPWEFQHKVRFGQPGTTMPSSVTGGGSDQNANDLGAFAQTLPTAPAVALTGDATAGQALYTARCTSCHALGSFDTVAEVANDLSGEAASMVNDLSSISTFMAGLATLTDQEVADLKAFIAAN